MNLEYKEFGKMPGGESVGIWNIEAGDIKASITDFGASIVSILSPDLSGDLTDVVLGYDNLDGYINDRIYAGATVGRVANRIDEGRFTLDGVTYQLARNRGEVHLHGGTKGFNKALWQSKSTEMQDGICIEMTYMSPDGEEGYPGNLLVKTDYTIRKDNTIRIDFYAQSDKKTIVNLTNHSYFNLAGHGDILDHELWLNSEYFLPMNKNMVPIGAELSVKNTPMDFHKPTRVGERINDNYHQLKLAGGYDHNYVISGDTSKIRIGAVLTEPVSGRRMEVFTSQPGMQFYSGNFLDGSVCGKKGVMYQKRSALCLETQHFPDAPNHDLFPSIELKPGDIYRQATVLRFTTV